jgi:lipid-A-disaccharide synthase
LNTAPKIALVAGEASGDLLSGLLLGGLRERWPAVQTYGIGGPRMAAQGFKAWWPHDKLAVRGYLEVLRHYREIAGIRRQLGDRLLQPSDRPDVFVGVDAPDFNLGLEERLKKSGIPTVHFVSPSLWAWRGKRIHTMHRSVDHVLCLFPFEPALYEAVGIAATYVGHPLASVIPMQADKLGARRALGLLPDDVVVAVMPGSRRSEIQYIAPAFMQAVALLAQERPHLRFVLPCIPALRGMIESAAAQAGVSKHIMLIDGQSHTALAACDVTLIASGTATLEAALFKRPMVIAYKMHPLSWALMRRMAYQPWFGLPNILLRDFAVPELIQEAATPKALATQTLAWLDDAGRTQVLQQRFSDLHHLLLRNTAQEASDAIARTI